MQDCVHQVSDMAYDLGFTAWGLRVLGLGIHMSICISLRRKPVGMIGPLKGPFQGLC